MLTIRGLNKTYPSGIQALRDVSLDVQPGMFGLLGPNGAGKTTLMKILATLLEPDSGSVEMRGLDLLSQKQETRRMLGFLPQEFGFYPTLTAEQTLDYFARLKGVNRTDERNALVDSLLEKVNLSSQRRQRVGGFSGGMRQRLGIAQAVIGQPALLIVDEPTAGLDPEERARFHYLLSEMADDKTVVLLSTHIVSDVSQLCCGMAVIRQGRIVAVDTPQDALRKLEGVVWEITVTREEGAALKPRLRTISAQMVAGKVRLRVIDRSGRPAEGFKPTEPSLEDYYFDLVSQELPQAKTAGQDIS